MTSQALSRKEKLEARIAEEEAQIAGAFEKTGIHQNILKESDLDDLLLQVNLSIPDIAVKWENGDPLMLLVVETEDNKAALCYGELILHTDPKREPLVFVVGDYAKKIQTMNPDKPPLTIAVAAVGFFGECIRGMTAGSVPARYYLSQFLKLLFPGKTRVYMNVRLEESFVTTFTVTGSFSAA